MILIYIFSDIKVIRHLNAMSYEHVQGKQKIRAENPNQNWGHLDINHFSFFPFPLAVQKRRGEGSNAALNNLLNNWVAKCEANILFCGLVQSRPSVNALQISNSYCFDMWSPSISDAEIQKSQLIARRIQLASIKIHDTTKRGIHFLVEFLNLGCISADWLIWILPLNLVHPKRAKKTCIY